MFPNGACWCCWTTSTEVKTVFSMFSCIFSYLGSQFQKNQPVSDIFLTINLNCFAKEDSAHVCVFTPQSLWCKYFEGVEGVICCDGELFLMPILLFNSVWSPRLSRVGFKFLRREAASFWKFHEHSRKERKPKSFGHVCLSIRRILFFFSWNVFFK